MKRAIAIALASIVLLHFCDVAHAQTRKPLSTAAHALSEEAQMHVLTAGTTLRTTNTPEGRFDPVTGQIRAAYHIEPKFYAGSLEEAARQFLAEHAAEYGLDPSTNDLEVSRLQEGPYSSHVTFRQEYKGLPVYDRQVKVSFDRVGRPVMVINSYAAQLRAATLDVVPTLTDQNAVSAAQALFTAGTIRLGSPELLVFPAAQPRLVWRLVAWVDSPSAEWEILLDAHSGEAVQLMDLSTHPDRSSAQELIGAPSRRFIDASQVDQRSLARRNLTTFRVDGTGLVFDPDPLSTAGVLYGPPYEDADDGDVPELNAQRKEVTLRDIVQDPDGLYRLKGPYVEINGEAHVGGTAYTVPAETSPLFHYGRNSDFFEAVMAYYHIDLSQRYVQSLDMGRTIQNNPVTVNPHGLGPKDDSKYYPNQNAIAFGTGGIDDAEDADVILHEYGHALLEDSAPDLRRTLEGQALHEGWADYWAASYSRAAIEEARIPMRDWRRVFDWDGNLTWTGRTLGNEGHYPETTTCEDINDSMVDGCNIWEDGTFWAGALMEIYSIVGRTVSDRLNLASHAYLGHPVTFIDAAEALIQADRDLYGAAHKDVLLQVLGSRGLIDPSQFGPFIVHDPIAHVSEENNILVFRAQVSSGLLPVQEVRFFYNYSGEWEGPLALSPEQSGWYVAHLPLPNFPGLIRYYFEAQDTGGDMTSYPYGGRTHPFQATAGRVEAINLLHVARAAEGWKPENNNWIINSVNPHDDQSELGLVLTPHDLPRNARQLLLVLDHAYSLQEGLGANIKVSIDDGRTWNIVHPDEDYPGLFKSGTQISGQPVFVGNTTAEGQLSVFDLSEYAGEHVLVRLDLGVSRRNAENEYWRIRSLTLYRSTFDSSFDVPVQTALHAVYPNPFSEKATLTFTIAEPSLVRIEVFDVLGRRVEQLMDNWVEQGTYALPLDGSRLSDGTYLVRLIVGRNQHVQKVVISR